MSLSLNMSWDEFVGQSFPSFPFSHPPPKMIAERGTWSEFELERGKNVIEIDDNWSLTDRGMKSLAAGFLFKCQFRFRHLGQSYFNISHHLSVTSASRNWFKDILLKQCFGNVLNVFHRHLRPCLKSNVLHKQLMHIRFNFQFLRDYVQPSQPPPCLTRNTMRRRRCKYSYHTSCTGWPSRSVTRLGWPGFGEFPGWLAAAEATYCPSWVKSTQPI